MAQRCVCPEPLVTSEHPTHCRACRGLAPSDDDLAHPGPSSKATAADIESATDGFTLDQRTEMSEAFSAGNYANAYETTDLSETDYHEYQPHARAAFVLGFFGSYSLSEIGGDERDEFDEAYHSPAGRYVVEVAKYTDDRAEEYAAFAAEDE